MGRPVKSLEQLVRDGTFLARKHASRIDGPDLSHWPAFAAIQARYLAATSDAERAKVALAFEHAVRNAHAELAAHSGPAGQLEAELAQLGNPGSVEQLLAFLPAYLVHPKGPMRGEPFVAEQWQRGYLREFYRRDRHGNRLYQRGYLALPRGNGKTMLGAALGVYELVTRTDAPEIYFAAGSRKQAEIAFSFAKAFVEDGPLRDWIQVKKGSLFCPATGGTLRVISSEGALQHGLAPSVAIVDETWTLQNRAQEETYKALATALHKRDNTYLLVLSTAGYSPHSLLGRIYTQATSWPDQQIQRNGCLLKARDLDNSLLMYWYGAPADADIDDEQIWRACNPASFVKLSELRKQRHDPGLDENDFRRLALNQWASTRDAWISPHLWASLADNTIRIPAGGDIFLGIDIGLTHDTTALAYAHPLPDGRIILRARVWSANPRKPAHHHVPQLSANLEELEEFINDRLATRFRIREIAYDPRDFRHSAERLAKHGHTLIEYRPASAPMLDAVQRFLQLSLGRRLLHTGDRILAQHIDATIARPTTNGWKLGNRNRTTQAIDATIASVLAATRADLNDIPRPRIDFLEWD